MKRANLKAFDPFPVKEQTVPILLLKVRYFCNHIDIPQESEETERYRKTYECEKELMGMVEVRERKPACLSEDGGRGGTEKQLRGRQAFSLALPPFL